MLHAITASVGLIDTTHSWSPIDSFGVAGFTLLMFFIILSVIEAHRPRKRLPRKGMKNSLRVNIALFSFNSLVLSFLSISTLLTLAERFSGAGLLSSVSSPLLKASLSLLLLDLMFYLWHKACHDFEGLWMFHRVHHSEPYLQTSTAFRVHFLEVLIAALIKSAAIVAFGIDKASVLAYEFLMMLFVMFHHGNLAFKHEKALGRLFIVPYLHRVHHSTERAEHDSNYGAIFSVWDRLFGTLIEAEPKAIGLHREPPLTFFKLLMFGVASEPQPAAAVGAQDTAAMIAEAAYYKAERRGFRPGNELYDWLEAEREVMRKVYAANAVTKQQGLEVLNRLKLGFKKDGVMQH